MNTEMDRKKKGGKSCRGESGKVGKWESGRAVIGLLTSIAVIALAALAPVAKAIIVENLPQNTTAYAGYTHRVVLTYRDVTNGASSSLNTVTLLPYTTTGSGGTLLSNTVVESFGYVLDTSFTNSTTAATNLQIFVGFGNTVSTGLRTNSLCSAIEVDGRSLAVQNTSGGIGPLSCFNTNGSWNISGSSNTLVCVFQNTNGMSGYNYGKITLLFRLKDMRSLTR